MHVPEASVLLPDPAQQQAGLTALLPGFGRQDWLSQTGSTNADLLLRGRQGHHGDLPWLLGTHQQQAGRGRAGRPWRNRSGAALMFSCGFEVHAPAARLPFLSFLAGMIACETLRRIAPATARHDIGLKWPNDVQFGQAKLAGILVESMRLGSGFLVVMGIGINLADAEETSLHLGREVADWSQVLRTAPAPAPQDACMIVASLAQAWQQAVAEFEHGTLGDVDARFGAIDALRGRAVNVIDRDHILLSGTAAGIDHQGCLRVETEDGRIHPVSIGEISVRTHS